jgi:alpha-tubulin suppressor-like RCC1 family protein
MTTFYKISGIPFEDYYITKDLYTDGGLWSWGWNFYGQLGDNTSGTGTYKSSPVQTVTYGTNWKSLDCSSNYTAAIKTDGTLWLWGQNNLGQLGDTTLTDRSSPIQTVAYGTNWKLVSAGHQHTAAIKTDGTLWLWGRGNEGQLGDNNITGKSSPVQTVTFGTNWKLVSCGYADYTTAIKTDGTLWSWGDNSAGQLGDNTSGNGTGKSSPIQTVTYGTNWKSVSCGYQHTAAIKTDGTLWLWGSNIQGQLGINAAGTNRSSPVQTVAYGTNWKLVNCGRYHTTAIKTDGTLWLWGQNNNGQLGDNTSGGNKPSPVQTVAYGTNWKSVSCGYYNNAAIKTDGTLWLWGRNNYGQLGNNTSGAGTDKSSPVQTVAYGTNWKLIDCGGYHVAAIKDNS